MSVIKYKVQKGTGSAEEEGWGIEVRYAGLTRLPQRGDN